MATKSCCSGTSELAQSVGLKGFPQTDDEVRKAQEALAKDLEKLSLVEHERVLFDVHGIAQVDDEDPSSEVVAQSLKELQEELDKLEKRTYYDRAHKANPSFVEDTNFRLMFLRAEGLDKPGNAAARILRFFDIKKKLFGSRLYVKFARAAFPLASSWAGSRRRCWRWRCRFRSSG